MCTRQEKPLLFESLYETSLLYADIVVCEELRAPYYKKKYVFMDNCDSFPKEKFIEFGPYLTVITEFNFSNENNCLAQVTFVNWDNFK